MAELNAEIDRFAEGTRVRVTERSASGDSDMDDSAGRVGAEYDVCYPVPADAKGNDDPLGKAYLLLDDEGSYGGSHWAYPEHVEIVRTVKERDARKPPKVKHVRAEVASALHHSFGDRFTITETEPEGDDAIRAYGTTADDLRVSFRVRIDQIERADW